MIRRAGGLSALFLVVVLGSSFADAAEAGIYKCTGPDGKTRYTSDRSQCRNAEPQILKRKLQNVLDHGAARSRASRPAAQRHGAAGDGLESMWRAKRSTAERRLEEAEHRTSEMRKVIRSCNRGGEWYKTQESGIRKHIPCSELREKLAEAQQKRDDLVQYLADGLEDECRRAGCRPGWVR